MKIYSIYRVTNKINSKVYIGFTTNLVKRKSAHKKSGETGGDTKFYRAIHKYGWNNFRVEAIYQSLDYEHTLQVMENYFIIEYNSINNGYNSREGGYGAVTVSGDNHPMKLPEQRKRQGDAIRGKNNPIHKISDDKKKEIISGLFTEDAMKKKSGMNHYNVDKTPYQFQHTKTGELVVLPKYIFARTYNLFPSSVTSIVTGERKTTGGWKFVPW